MTKNKKVEKEIKEQEFQEEILLDKDSTENQDEIAQDENQEVQDEEVSLEVKLEKEVAELKEKYLRLYSDFENFRKRTAKERIEMISTASQELLVDLLPAVDDFERAFKANENEEDATKVLEGNRIVFQKLLKILNSKGLKPMEDMIGKPFDPDTQEAITQIPAPSEDMKGKVIDVIEKGYTLGDRVVRFAKVVTGA
ncbi:nucleotide exchange factor GrpE [Algoriphagus sediminis]|uniref:Protein GrpE n=1 Tax=Algoriphagus sediminis TaxID=3057113 RepID=A0ABT7YF14_9BACT|nr:nucleotide exchange factor GrpE [Algoriphagus sediminis]MDN3205114.1 nucleotide exchange factor GrpE [Algoriphagus sediminis]